MDVCRLHLRSIYSMSSRFVEDFLSIENQLYTCYYYARLESPTTDVRSDNLFDSDCMRLYQFSIIVPKLEVMRYPDMYFPFPIYLPQE